MAVQQPGTGAGTAKRRRPQRRRTPRMLDAPIRGKKAWTPATITESDYRVPVGEDVLGEMAAFVDTLRRNPLQTELLSPADHRLPRTRTLMARVQRVLDRGVGFVVLDHFPVTDFDKNELKTIYWLTSSLIARPVAQSFEGTMLYDVHDTGRIKGPTVRADVTRQALAFHTDYGYNEAPPYIGLACLRTAKRGGRNSVASLYAAHNILRREAPALLARLYRPFWLNRYSVHAPGDPPASSHPVFAYDGHVLKARFNHRNIIAGHDLAGEPLDEEGLEAIDTLTRILESSRLRLDFDLAPGEFFYLMNWRIAHNRTAFVDYARPDRRRHLVRIFLRDHGARTYNG